nr:hypothetical protein [Tanacetum cinerariifolium]
MTSQRRRSSSASLLRRCLERYVANIGLSTIHKEECCEAALRKYNKNVISIVKFRKTPYWDNMRHEICVVKLL